MRKELLVQEAYQITNRFNILSQQALQEDAFSLHITAERIEKFAVRMPDPYLRSGNLTGGKQEKEIVARAFSRPVKPLGANQPTLSLNVGSIELIHRRIVEHRDAGVAVLLVPADLDEVLGLADQIAVMSQSRIGAIVPATEATRENLGFLMAGSQPITNEN